MNQQETIKLDYIDKLWNLVESNDSKLSSIFFIQTIFSLILINLSIGLISINKTYSVLGISFDTTPWLIFVSLIIIIDVLYICQLHLVISTKENRFLILKLYKELNFQIRDKHFACQNNIMSFMTNLRDSFEHLKNPQKYLFAFPFLLIGNFATLLLPITAIIFGNIGLLKLINYHFLGYIMPIISIYLPIAYIMLRFEDQ